MFGGGTPVLLCGLGVAMALLVVELRSPYAFCQDDNRDYFLPLWSHATRAVSHGELAEFNFHQSLGSPNLGAGQPGALNPMAIACVGASRVLWGHPFAAMDVFAGVHLLLAALGGLYLGRVLRLAPLASVFLGMAWALNPACISLGRSWIHTVVLQAALPWIIGALVGLIRRPLKRDLVVLVVAHLALFLVGYVQWLVVVAALEAGVLALAAVLGLRRAVRRALPWLLVAAALTATLSLPLLLPMLHQAAVSADRAGVLTYGLFGAQALPFGSLWNGLIVPWRRVAEVTGRAPFIEVASPPGWAHLGYLVPIGVGAAPFLWRRRSGNPIRRWWIVFVSLAVVLLAWATGLLAPVLYHVPLLNRFRWPFKLYPLFALAMLVASSLGVSLLVLGWATSRSRRCLLGAAGAVVAANLVWVVQGGEPEGFFTHTDPLPLQEPAPLDWRDGRLATFGFDTAPGQRGPTAAGLGFNYATLWGLWHFGGYEPLASVSTRLASLHLNVEASFLSPPRPELVSYLRAWAVRWYVVDPTVDGRVGGALREQGLRVARREPGRIVYEDPSAAPLAKASGPRCRVSGSLGATTNSLTVPVSCPDGGQLRLAVLRSPGLSASAEGEATRLESDEMGRIVIAVPPGARRIRLEYRAPYFRAGILLSVALLTGLGAFLWLRRSSLVTSRG
jgi:hypothetical protein